MHWNWPDLGKPHHTHILTRLPLFRCFAFYFRSEEKSWKNFFPSFYSLLIKPKAAKHRHIQSLNISIQEWTNSLLRGVITSSLSVSNSLEMLSTQKTAYVNVLLHLFPVFDLNQVNFNTVKISHGKQRYNSLCGFKKGKSWLINLMTFYDRATALVDGEEQLTMSAWTYTKHLTRSRITVLSLNQKAMDLIDGACCG